MIGIYKQDITEEYVFFFRSQALNLSMTHIVGRLEVFQCLWWDPGGNGRMVLMSKPGTGHKVSVYTQLYVCNKCIYIYSDSVYF